MESKKYTQKELESIQIVVKEYRVEDDLIIYNKENNTLAFNKIKDVQDPKNVIYFVKLIKKDNYLVIANNNIFLRI